jgi:hypothetical protein
MTMQTWEELEMLKKVREMSDEMGKLAPILNHVKRLEKKIDELTVFMTPKVPEAEPMRHAWGEPASDQR